MVLGMERKIENLLPSSTQQNRPFRIVDCTKTAMKFTKVKNARAKRAKTFFIDRCASSYVIVVAVLATACMDAKENAIAGRA